MTSRGRRLLLGVLACAVCAPVSGAGAVGPPLPSSATGRAGAVAPGGTERFLTQRVRNDTLVRVVGRRDGRLLRAGRIAGRWTISAATIEGATTGLSADGGVLVLARPERAFPPPSTQLAVLDATKLLVRRRISLPGFFSVDAISPDGSWLYLIQYSGGDPLDYRVRVLDTRTGRLAPRAVVDPRNPGEQMGGLPLSRAMSRDGRWAYTLYLGGEEPFIHALDTVGRTAACVDLDMLPRQGDMSGYRLRVSAAGDRIDVRRAGSVIASVDARTFAVSEPGVPATSEAKAPAAPRRASEAPADGGGFPWWVLLPVAGLCVLAALGRRLHLLDLPR
jgi:hypothetical protein